MINRFKEFILSNQLCNIDGQVLLAVSGGIDSVVMTDLFCTSGYDCILLHCNFELRGEESDGDEAFVRSLAARYEIPVFVKHFDTAGFAEDNGISIQMAARELRYEWFNTVYHQQQADQIATAHNLNDSVETVFLNLSRATGIKGLTGIPVQNRHYIRPLLFATREEIENYARLHHLQYREDSSNKSRRYQRNMIRHDVFPLFESINPGFIRTMGENISRFSDAHNIYRKKVDEIRDVLFTEREGYIEIDLGELRKLSPQGSWLYELFSDYGYSMDQCLNIAKILDSESGKQFVSPSHRLYKDREKLLLFKASEPEFQRYYIDSPESHATLPFAMDMEVLDRKQIGEYGNHEHIAYLDMEELKFPLMLRKWQHGDYFYPLGMDQMKKVSDFFIDNKIPVPIKNNTWLLTSGSKIVWITGLRIDHRFRIKPGTKKVLKLEIYR